MSKISPHDEYFRAVFTEDTVRDFISGFFPKGLADNLVLKTLTRTSDSYVDKQLKASYADLVFHCNYGESPVQVSLLFEHKSSPESHVRLQLLRYMLNSWEGQLKAQESLRPVIPVIIYHGKPKWESVKLRDYFKGIDQYLQAFIPEFDYLLSDIGRIKDDQIRRDFRNYQLQVCLQMMKYIFDEEELLERYQKIFSMLHDLVSDQQGVVFFEQTLTYILRSTNLEEQKVIDLSKSISPKGGEIAMTTAEKLEQRGMKKGREEGRQEGREEGIYTTAENLIKKGVDIDIVKDCTGLSDEAIQKLIEGSKK